MRMMMQSRMRRMMMRRKVAWMTASGASSSCGWILIVFQIICTCIVVTVRMLKIVMRMMRIVLSVVVGVVVPRRRCRRALGVDHVTLHRRLASGRGEHGAKVQQIRQFVVR